MKKISLEESFKKYTPVLGEKSVPSTPTSSKTRVKGKVAKKSLEVKEIPKPNVPLTRSSAKKLQSREETPENIQPIEMEKKKTTHGKDQHTINRLREQLREAQEMIIQLREENRREQMKFTKL
jgi:hypothetical protein